MALQGFLTLKSTQAWAYRSPDDVSLDRTLKFAITCEFTLVPSNLPADQAVVIQHIVHWIGCINSIKLQI